MQGFHNGICNVIAQKGSNIQVVYLNLLNKNTKNFYVMNNKVEEDASLEYIITELGGKISITNNYINSAEKGANAKINAIYIGENEKLIDLNYIVEAYGEKSNIDINVCGALQDKSQKNFKGTIDFKKGCKKSKGNENEYCMLLSKHAKSKALPMILCNEEEVQGNHSNSAGKIDSQKLYYLMTRGISEQEAKKLIVKTHFSKITKRIHCRRDQKEIIQEIDGRLK